MIGEIKARVVEQYRSQRGCNGVLEPQAKTALNYLNGNFFYYFQLLIINRVLGKMPNSDDTKSIFLAIPLVNFDLPLEPASL